MMSEEIDLTTGSKSTPGKKTWVEKIARKVSEGLGKYVVSAAATSPSTRVLGLVAAALTTKVKNKGSSPGHVIYTCTAPFLSAYVTL
jgi:hypothetical protein